MSLKFENIYGSVNEDKKMSRYTTTEVGWVCVAAIPIMLQAFKEGVRFVLTPSVIFPPVAMIDGGIIKYTARYYKVDQEMHCIVTNDERRRLVPLLKTLI
jgi:hypothetical protein